MKNKIIIYGASGYVGKLLIKQLTQSQIPFITAGRSANKDVEIDLVCSLTSQTEIVENIKGAVMLINLAGPFSETSNPLIEACIKAKVHYFDIAGEYNEFKSAQKYHSSAKEAGVMIMPGIGFGVVPTDIAAYLASKLIKDPTHLSICYGTKGGASRGTLRTVLRDINSPGVRIQDGNAILAAPASEEKRIVVDGDEKTFELNPWRGDLFSAGVTTGIKNITTYTEFPGIIVSMMQGKMLFLRNLLLKHIIKLLPEGPNEKQLRSGSTYINAEVINAKNEKANVIIIGPEAYIFTVYCIEKVINEIQNHPALSGFQTPSVLGHEFLKSIPQVEIKQIKQP